MEFDTPFAESGNDASGTCPCRGDYERQQQAPSSPARSRPRSGPAVRRSIARQRPASPDLQTAEDTSTCAPPFHKSRRRRPSKVSEGDGFLKQIPRPIREIAMKGQRLPNIDDFDAQPAQHANDREERRHVARLVPALVADLQVG